MSKLGWLNEDVATIADYWANFPIIESDISELPYELSEALLPLLDEVPTQDVEQCYKDAQEYVKKKLFPR